MHEITENATLEMTNVLSFRGKMTQQQIRERGLEIDRLILANHAEKVGTGASATFSVDASGMTPLVDIEILIPLNKSISVDAPYKFKPVFRLKNAVRIRHEGNPATLRNTADELMQYISTHGLTPITAGYNVTVKEPSGPEDINSMIVDIYVGVTDNIL